jgi:DNA repair protein RadC
MARRIAEYTSEERQALPIERLIQLGSGVLGPAELVAIILNTGIKGESVIDLSHRVLREHDGLSGLMRMDHSELAQISGIGPVKAARLKAALEMGRRLNTMTDEDRPRIGTPEDVVHLFGVEMAYLEQEQLRVVLLNTKHHIIGTVTVAGGSVNSASVRMAEVFAPAVKRVAPYIMLVHNHPTGDPTPSSADVQFTYDAVRAGELLDIGVLDHVIIGQGRHSSLRRLGLGFPAQEAP